VQITQRQFEILAAQFELIRRHLRGCQALQHQSVLPQGMNLVIEERLTDYSRPPSKAALYPRRHRGTGQVP
jgi:hypothetical protein